MASQLKNKPKQEITLHKFVALGGDPRRYKVSKGINSETVPNCTCGTKNAVMPKVPKK